MVEIDATEALVLDLIYFGGTNVTEIMKAAFRKKRPSHRDVVALVDSMTNKKLIEFKANAQGINISITEIGKRALDEYMENKNKEAERNAN